MRSEGDETTREEEERREPSFSFARHHFFFWTFSVDMSPARFEFQRSSRREKIGVRESLSFQVEGRACVRKFDGGCCPGFSLCTLYRDPPKLCVLAIGLYLLYIDSRTDSLLPPFSLSKFAQHLDHSTSTPIPRSFLPPSSLRPHLQPPFPPPSNSRSITNSKMVGRTSFSPWIRIPSSLGM